MESNNISTKIISILIPLILVLVVLVPITNAVSGDGEGGPRTITQDGTFMKEVNLDELDKTQTNVLLTVDDMDFEDGQVVAMMSIPNMELESEMLNDAFAYRVIENQPKFVDTQLDEDMIMSITSFTDKVIFDDTPFDEMSLSSMDSIKIVWYNNNWCIEDSYGLTQLQQGTKLYIASSEESEMIMVRSPDYKNDYYIDDISLFLIGNYVSLREFNISSSVGEDWNYITYEDYFSSMYGYGLGREFFMEDEGYEGDYPESLNYTKYKPLTVDIENSKVIISSKWDFSVFGERITPDMYNTPFAGIIPYKVTVEGGDGGISGPVRTLIQMIPIFALLGILSALIIPTMRKEESI